MAHKTKQQQIDKIWRDNRWLWFFPGLVVGLIIGLPIRLGDSPANWFVDGIWPETVGILVTVFFIDRLNKRRDEQRAQQDLQIRLVRDAGSSVNDVALKAIEELRAHGWLTGEDGLLKGANLTNANLQKANLNHANLQRATLVGANLQEAELTQTNLDGASLSGANLQGAWLSGVDLQGVIWWHAKLDGASLVGVNLQGARLTSANFEKAYLIDVNLKEANLFRANLKGADLNASHLEGANLLSAEYDEDTIFPDESKWSPDLTDEELTERFGVVFEAPIGGQR